MALTTYTAVGNREDLSDIITNISPTETPLYSMFGKATAKATYHEWIEDSLAAPEPTQWWKAQTIPSQTRRQG